MKSKPKSLSFISTMTLTGIFTALIAVSAFIKIPIQPVAITLQTFFVVLSALLLGAKLSTISVAIYLLLGLLGLPIFTMGGGISYVLQPTFGYLIGFLGMSVVTGSLAHIKQNKIPHLLQLIIAGILGLLMVYLFGVIHLYIIQNIYLKNEVSLWQVIYSGMILFLPGDIITTLLACSISPRIRSAVPFLSTAKK